MSANETIFRTHKRKRVLKRHQDDAEDAQFELQPSPAIAPPTTTDNLTIVEDDSDKNGIDSETEDSGTLPISEIIRRRKIIQSRRGGIEFSNAHQKQRRGTDVSNEGTVTTMDKPNVLEMAAKRFAPQTGLVTESTDQHM